MISGKPNKETKCNIINRMHPKINNKNQDPILSTLEKKKKINFRVRFSPNKYINKSTIFTEYLLFQLFSK
jgi:hypothetical protein